MATAIYRAATSGNYRGLKVFAPVTITNSQSGATGSNFQQLFTINSNSYSGLQTGNLGNVYFTDTSFSAVSSWLESGETNTSTTTNYWLLLASGISGSSSFTVNLIFDLSMANAKNTTTNGAEPNYTGTYAQYDNGAVIFYKYWNFAGTTMPTGWTAVSSPTFNNGVTLDTTSFQQIYTSTTYNPQAYVFHAKGYISAPYAVPGYIVIGWGANSSPGQNMMQVHAQNGDYLLYNYNGSGSNVDMLVASSTVSHIFYNWNTSTTNYGQIDGGTVYTNSTNFTNSTAMTAVLSGGTGSSPGETSVFNYVAFRLIPPNNAMPTTSIGSLQVYPIMVA